MHAIANARMVIFLDARCNTASVFSWLIFMGLRFVWAVERSMQKVRAMVFGAATLLCFGSIAGQGTGAAVSGQVSIVERPGETTEDLGDVVAGAHAAEPIPARDRNLRAAGRRPDWSTPAARCLYRSTSITSARWREQWRTLRLLAESCSIGMQRTRQFSRRTRHRHVLCGSRDRCRNA